MILRRNLKGKKPRNRKRKLYFKISLFLVVFIILSTYVYEYIDKQVLPTLFEIAEMRVHAHASTLVNEAIKQVIVENNIDTNDLVTYFYNDKGEITSTGINTMLINRLGSEVVDKISKNIEALGLETVYIPLGSVMNSNVFANVGPRIAIEILPIGNTSINYDREFRSTGINQVNHRVWFNIDTTLQIVVPMATEKITISQEFTLVDNVISGTVPPNYIHVPGNNILDVAPDIFRK